MKVCDCELCRLERGEFIPMCMYVCPVCHNKRCPKALWHGYKCTGSNEVDQVAELDPCA